MIIMLRKKNSKCSLCGEKDRDETVIYMISECNKLAQNEYKTRHDWVGIVIHRKLYKILKFDHIPYLPTPPLGQDMTHGQF